MNIDISTLHRKTTQLLLLTFFSFFASISHADILNPQHLLEKATTATFQRIESEQQQIQDNPDHLRAIIEQELMPHIDHKFAAFKVLGNQFRSVPKERIPEFVSEFKQYLISDFAVALASYGGQKLLFAPVADYQNKKNLDVKAVIKSDGAPDIRINFKLRKSKATQEWKTYDLVAEGISLLSSKRSEFSAIIRQQGIQAAIDSMRDKNNQPLTLASN